MSVPFYTAAGDRAAGYNGENAYGRYQRWLADAQNYAASKGRQVDPAALAEIARGGIKYAEEHGFGPTGFDFTGAQSNTLNPGEAVEYLAAGNRPNQYQTDDRGLTVWQPGLGGASAAGAFDAYAGHGAGPDWGAMLANPGGATAAFDSGPGGPLPSTPTGTIFPGGGGADPYAGYGATPAHWTDALQAELGGHTMSAPMGSGLSTGATAGMGAPAPPVGGGGGGGGGLTGTAPGILLNSPELAWRYLQQLMGADPTIHGAFSDYNARVMQPAAQAYLNAILGPGGQGMSAIGPGFADLARMFQSGDLYGGLSGAADKALGAGGLGGVLNNADVSVAAPWLQRMFALKSMNAGPLMGNSLQNQLEDMLAGYSDEAIRGGGINKSKFGDYTINSPWFQGLGLGPR